jgi:hypothetical protein
MCMCMSVWACRVELDQTAPEVKGTSAAGVANLLPCLSLLLQRSATACPLVTRAMVSCGDTRDTRAVPLSAGVEPPLPEPAAVTACPAQLPLLNASAANACAHTPCPAVFSFGLLAYELLSGELLGVALLRPDTFRCGSALKGALVQEVSFLHD